MAADRVEVARHATFAGIYGLTAAAGDVIIGVFPTPLGPRIFVLVLCTLLWLATFTRLNEMFNAMRGKERKTDA